MVVALSILSVSLVCSSAARGCSASGHSRMGQSKMVAELTKPTAISTEPALHPAFELVKVEEVGEYALKCATYRHIKSGAELISAQADDDNKVFGIVFPTPVTDSTGVPHILEHSVLCGSDKYTSKEPFAELLKGSLQTFLNAFTYPDRTCYPVASQNTKDFYNLCNVYLDAVLNPRAKTDPMVLAQEGWHYELEDPEAPLTYKGVVFNEMKGVYSSPDSLLYRAAQQATFPDNTYAVDSGGDPATIPSLTFAQFTAFHDAYYHPANSKIFFYGDDDPAVRLALLDTYLSRFDAPPTPPASSVATQPLKHTPWRVEEPYPVAPEAAEEATHMVMVNWLTHEEPLAAVDELALGVLDHLLMGSTTADLYKPLIESGLGTAVVGGGLSDELKQATFSVGLKGVKPEDVAAVEQLALDTLAKVVGDGFDADAIAASMNTVEFQMREFNTGGFPKGLSLMLAIMPRWLYGRGAPLDALRFEGPLAELKERLSRGERVYEDLLQRLLLDNGHRVTVEMRPDPALTKRLQEAEEEELRAAKEKMDADEIAGVIEATAELKRQQLAEDSAEALATIPRVGLADLERKVKVVPTEVTALGDHGATLLTHPLPTAGVVYSDVLLDMSSLPLDELPVVRLFSRMLFDVGTSQVDAVTLDRMIGAQTGGISAAMIFEQPTGDGGAVADPLGVSGHVALRGKATGDKVGNLFDLIGSVLGDARLDNAAKAIEILRESKQNLESSFVSSGHTYAGMRLSARTSLVGYIAETTQGVTYYESVKGMLQQAQEDWPALLHRLQKVRDSILAQDKLIINLTADPAVLDAIAPSVAAFAAGLPASATEPPAAPWRETVQLFPAKDEAYAITTQVNYVAAAQPLLQQGEKADGSFYAVARYLSRGYLWDNVRVVGGAYGGGCSLNTNTGMLSFSSYRDPNLQGTLDTYGKTIAVLDELELSDEALEQAIVGAVGDLDSPLTSEQKGWRALMHHLSGITTEVRQAYRDEILATDRSSFAAFADRLRAKPMQCAVFGAEEALAKANAGRDAGAQIEVKTLV